MQYERCVMCNSLEEAWVWKHHFDREGSASHTVICKNCAGTYSINAYTTEDDEWETPRKMMVDLNHAYEEKTKPVTQPKEPRKPSRFEDIIQ